MKYRGDVCEGRAVAGARKGARAWLGAAVGAMLLVAGGSGAEGAEQRASAQKLEDGVRITGPYAVCETVHHIANGDAEGYALTVPMQGRAGVDIGAYRALVARDGLVRLLNGGDFVRPESMWWEVDREGACTAHVSYGEVPEADFERPMPQPVPLGAEQ